jgi:hypothetical protein
MMLLLTTLLVFVVAASSEAATVASTASNKQVVAPKVNHCLASSAFFRDWHQRQAKFETCLHQQIGRQEVRTLLQGVYIIRWDFNEFFMFHVF